MTFKSKPCPKCRENGRDTRGDNLNVWPDGHGHCFACEYHEWCNSDGIIQAAGKMANAAERIWIGQQSAKEHVLKLPPDCTNIIDFEALCWLAKYEISTEEVKRYKMVWSPSKKMLIFPFYADEYEPDFPADRLMGWQGRSFNPAHQQRYYKVGGFTEFYNVLNISNGVGSDIIIVEDFISAIKIARRYTSMALMGSTLSTSRMKGLIEFTQCLTFWLDEDKAEKAYRLAQTARMLNFNSKFIITKHDPKEYTDDQIAAQVETHIDASKLA